jgi:hypothetical protein
MQGFITDVLLDLKKKNVDFSELKFILPSRRSGVFLKRELSKLLKNTIFAPEIFSIEEFVKDISELNSISNVDLLFEFYSVYLNIDGLSEKDSFDAFVKWAQILLQDFNEIDRYLIDSSHIFDYLTALKKIEEWNLEIKKTSSKRYLNLWKNINNYYKNLTSVLVSKGQGYQGLIYREAVNNLQSYIQNNNNNEYVFLGFNALNKAESIILQEFLETGLAQIYFDCDIAFVEDKFHSAGKFIREHKEWPYFRSNSFNWLTNKYAQKKNITIISTPKGIGQAKSVGEILIKKESFSDIAVVLADENLLSPIINELPNKVNSLNITMGFPLRNIPLTSLIERLLLIHQNKPHKYYYKDVTSVLSHQSIQQLFIGLGFGDTNQIISRITLDNHILIPLEDLQYLSQGGDSIINLLFSSWDDNPQKAIDSCISLVYHLKEVYSKNKEKNQLNLEYLYRFYELFIALNKLHRNYNYITSIKVLYGIFKELLHSETLDFQGEPLQGLQIMGMLESRVLDFETVIITSVNEGILPSGKTDNSFIPFDLKLQYGLPTYKEKDAVYCYHFYRLIQRAKNIYLIYNSEPDVLLGGEKSRFITQMEVEGVHKVEHLVYTPSNHPIKSVQSIIQKTPNVISKLKDVATKGFSPSSLSNYIRNPIDFYSQKVLGIKEYEEVEETVAANTLGTVVHNSLEDLYKPFEGKTISIDKLKGVIPKVNSNVNSHFKKVYKKGDIDKGMNLIIFEIAKRYVHNFIQSEIEQLKRGHEIKLLHTEYQLSVPVNIPDIGIPVSLVGTIDRIDIYDGTLRIIDYKSGKVEQSQLEIIDWEDITTDYKKYSKSFQVLTYAYMLNQMHPFEKPVEAGIISLKNQKKGFLKFAKKDSTSSRSKKESTITGDVLADFTKQLHGLIKEILDPSVPFVEKIVD